MLRGALLSTSDAALDGKRLRGRELCAFA